MRFFETWGRDIEVKFVTSSGNDEAAQRADLVAITAMKPFAVVNLEQPVGPSSVLETGLAAAKIPVMGYAATTTDTNAQAPYRWGPNDPQAAAINSAEVIGKQLVGKKARVRRRRRQERDPEVRRRVRRGRRSTTPASPSYFAKFGGKITNSGSFAAAALDDPTEVQTEAATMMAKMKDAGRDHGRDVRRLPAVRPADGERHEAGLLPGVVLHRLRIQRSRPRRAELPDRAVGARLRPVVHLSVDRARHAGTAATVPYATQVDPLNWYWGTETGTVNARLTTPVAWWLLAGIQAAGPNLTPKTFQQGLFALPPRGGAGTSADSSLVAYGKGPKLPYNEYALSGYDFAPYWWDTKTTGPSNGLGTVGKGVGWFVDGGKRYVATTWPKKQFAWFDKDQSIYHFTTPPTPRPGYVGDCKGCPSTGGSGDPSRAEPDRDRLQGGRHERRVRLT